MFVLLVLGSPPETTIQPLGDVKVGPKMFYSWVKGHIKLAEGLFRLKTPTITPTQTQIFEKKICVCKFLTKYEK